MFHYSLPLGAVAAAHLAQPDDKDPKKPGKDKNDDDKPDQVQTQMVGEKPGDDLGYDPKKIPVEPIPD